uniref:AT3G52170-like helix-turn-helix domain-containing protein n=1 Tax=Noccaea caerulescens TaxID=107243 RepID=A0A1J3GV21_NOCCA
MHSLKTSYAGQIFALAKPHDSLGKRTRNRIPKEERKTLVESFIKKHQRLNNGSFPSLSLTHKEVGGSFYTIREIVREIIQENRVLGTSDLILESNGSESLSSSILMDPVPPLSLSPNGFHSPSDQTLSSEAVETKSLEDGGNINGSILQYREMNGHNISKDDVGLLVHESVGSTDISRTQFEASCSEDNDTKSDTGLENRVQTVCDSLATKPQDEELNVDNNNRGFEEIPLIESEGTKSVNSDERVNDAGAAMSEMVNMMEYTLGTIDMPVETVVETFPVRSVTMESSGVQSSELDKVCEGGKGTEAKVETDSSKYLPAETVVETFPMRSATSAMELSDVQPNELEKVCEGGKGTGAKVETDSRTETSVDLGDISSSISAVPEEQRTEVIVSQTPNHTPVPMEKKVEEKIVNPASVDVESADSKGTVVVNAVIENILETKAFSNGTLTTQQKIPTSGPESGSFKNDIAKVETMSSHGRNEVASAEKATMEQGKHDASGTSSSQKGNIATLNRIKPESWKEQSNKAQETNPLLEVLKSFLTAFVKFWSE